MKLSIHLLTGLLLIAFGAGVGIAHYYLLDPSYNTTPPASFSGIQSAFCPSPGCVVLPTAALSGAKSRVWVAMYSFTNTDLASSLQAAKNKGLDVRVIVEKQQAGGKYSQHDELAAAGIPVRIDTNPSLMHDKFAVIDNDIVITGSMNWTGNGVGENNENVVIIASAELNQKFATEFDKIWNDSLPFEGGTIDASTSQEN